VRKATRLLPTNDPTNVMTGIFAVALCLTNALVWVFVAGQILVGIVWVAAAAGCFKLQAWSQGIN